MGTYCRICGASRRNEAFSGKGRKRRICKECALLPLSTIDSISQLSEIEGFMFQSHISKKNIIRLRELADSTNEQVASLATLVLEVSKVRPYKKRRLKVLSEKAPELLEKLYEFGLVAHYD